MHNNDLLKCNLCSTGSFQRITIVVQHQVWFRVPVRRFLNSGKWTTTSISSQKRSWALSFTSWLIISYRFWEMQSEMCMTTSAAFLITKRVKCFPKRAYPKGSNRPEILTQCYHLPKLLYFEKSPENTFIISIEHLAGKRISRTTGEETGNKVLNF